MEDLGAIRRLLNSEVMLFMLVFGVITIVEKEHSHI